MFFRPDNRPSLNEVKSPKNGSGLYFLNFIFNSDFALVNQMTLPDILEHPNIFPKSQVYLSKADKQPVDHLMRGTVTHNLKYLLELYKIFETHKDVNLNELVRSLNTLLQSSPMQTDSYVAIKAYLESHPIAFKMLNLLIDQWKVKQGYESNLEASSLIYINQTINGNVSIGRPLFVGLHFVKEILEYLNSNPNNVENIAVLQNLVSQLYLYSITQQNWPSPSTHELFSP